MEAGSFLLEFGMLSVLTGQKKFYQAAKRSLQAFWSGLTPFQSDFKASCIISS